MNFCGAHTKNQGILSKQHAYYTLQDHITKRIENIIASDCSRQAQITLLTWSYLASISDHNEHPFGCNPGFLADLGNLSSATKSSQKSRSLRVNPPVKPSRSELDSNLGQFLFYFWRSLVLSQPAFTTQIWNTIVVVFFIVFFTLV